MGQDHAGERGGRPGFRSATGGGAIDQLLRALTAPKAQMVLFWCSLCGAAHQDSVHFDRPWWRSSCGARR